MASYVGNCDPLLSFAPDGGLSSSSPVPGPMYATAASAFSATGGGGSGTGAGTGNPSNNNATNNTINVSTGSSTRLDEQCVGFTDGLLKTAGPRRIPVSILHELAGENVRMRDRETVVGKIARLIDGSRDSLQVISDFDRTLSAYFDAHGGHGLSTHGILEHCGLFSESYHVTTTELFKKYYPIEVDTSLSLEDKSKLMVEWWTQSHAQILSVHPTRRQIRTMVDHSLRAGQLVLRQGIQYMFQSTVSKRIPFLVFSAGVKDLIIQVLKQSNLAWSEDVHVLSNSFTYSSGTSSDPNSASLSVAGDNDDSHFNDDDRVVEFGGPLIHTMNKNSSVLRNFPSLCSALRTRKNAILLGDSLGDATMADGLDTTTCLRVGFLNADVDKNLDKYLNVFDVVILNDGSFGLVNAILDSV